MGVRGAGTQVTCEHNAAAQTLPGKEEHNWFITARGEEDSKRGRCKGSCMSMMQLASSQGKLTKGGQSCLDSSIKR